MIEASCHCGAIAVQVTSAPVEVTECSCSICRRYGVLWAYYRRSEVTIRSSVTDRYMWNDREISFHRCRHCGCVTHWWPEDPAIDRVGVNARLMDMAVLQAARVRHLDGAATGRYLD